MAWSPAASSPEMESPSLLFVSSVVPARSGSGIAMRAHATVCALASSYDVHLLLTAPALRRLPPPPEMLTLCASVTRVPVNPWREPVAFARVAAKRLLGAPFRPSRAAPSEWRALSVDRIRRSRAAVGVPEFDVIHVFRLYNAPFLAAFRARRTQLDIDDIESTTRRDLAALALAAGRSAEARRWERDAAAYERVEASLPRLFNRVFVASEADIEVLQRRGIAVRPEVLPNTVAAVEPPPRPSSTSPFTILFVATMSYPPNADAVWFLCEQVIPRLRAVTSRAFAFEVVGEGLPAAVRRFVEGCPELHLARGVPDLAPWYERAGAVIVPVRAGGGTRIKTLEALAHCRAVVATPKGVEGLRIRSGEHALVADSAEGLATCLARLIDSPATAAGLAERGYRLVKTHYAPAVLERVLRPAPGGG